MIVKIIIVLLGLLNGGWMVFDGFHVLLKGKYFGSEKPGPWSNIISFFGIDPFEIGPVFIIIGVLWLIFVISIITNQQWSWLIGMVACIVSLWYLPIGTLISIILLVLLVAFRGLLIGK